MTTNPNQTEPEETGDSEGPEEANSPRVSVGQFLLIVGLAFLFFLLAQSMVHHRFHAGGEIGRNGNIVP
jgi:hypothetical protein